jgi:DNA-binding MarR family transcriptional regulator
MTRRIPDGDRLAAWKDFLRAHTRVMRALERDLRRDAGMTVTQYDVLVHLSGADGGRLRMSELTGAVQYSSGAATKLLDPLVRDGLVRREPAPDDGRSVYAVITDEGRAAVGHAGRDHLKGIQREFGRHLQAEELDQVRAFLRRLADPPEHADPLT